MASERTLSIIKPDATRRNLTGKINAMIEAAGLRIIAQSVSSGPRPMPRPSMRFTRKGPSSTTWWRS